jgi:hypothetical protein
MKDGETTLRHRGQAVFWILAVSLAAIVIAAVAAWGIGAYRCLQEEAARSVSFVRPELNPQADNSACLDCHLDFADEPIVATHLEEGFGCTACHGESVAHGEDEANVTKPDVLFGRSQVDSFCTLCHDAHTGDNRYNEFMEEWGGRRRPTGVMLLDDATCMDCHGNHVLIGEG